MGGRSHEHSPSRQLRRTLRAHEGTPRGRAGDAAGRPRRLNAAADRLGIATIAASPFARTRQTAEIVAIELGLEIIYQPELSSTFRIFGYDEAQKISSSAIRRSASLSGRTVRPNGPVGAHRS
ncbi:MAG: histidine phosphatase family protein, partial [Acetobacteraceae bacterium]